MEKELRIGNIIFDDLNEVAKVCNIRGGASRNIEVYENFKNETGWITVCDPRPIPLTEEWLIKFGFINHETFWSKTWGTNGVVIITYSQVYKCFMYQLAQSVDKSISTVHQLQNLYYALTGEELTIFEPTKQSEG